jgi:DNA-binding transcriptional regulator PaaX
MSLSGAYAKIGGLQMELTKLQHRLENQENRIARLAKKEKEIISPEAPQEDEEWKQMVLANIEEQARMLVQMRASLEEPRDTLKAEGVFVLLFATWLYMFFFNYTSA